MASFNYHFRPSKREGATDGKLFIRVIHARQSKDIPTSISLQRNEWDETKGRIIYQAVNTNRNEFLYNVETTMQTNLISLKLMEKNLMRSGETYSATDLVKSFKSICADSSSLFSYCESVSKQLVVSGRPRTARAYRSATRRFLKYRNGNGVLLEDIDAGLMRNYEAYLKAEGLEKNTISFYIRNIRALYYRAIADKKIRSREDNPFLNVFTGVCQSRKRALNREEVHKLRDLQDKLAEMPPEPGIRKRRFAQHLLDSLEYFNFCLEGRGISWIDMVYLKKSDLQNDTFTYRRKKTGGKLDIIITERMRRIIDDFAERTKDSPYVFPVLKPGRGNHRRQYESGLKQQNDRLSILANMAGIDKKITTHVSRHTWATVAKNNNIEIAVISELLGHSNINITYRYLDSIENQQAIQATRAVTNALRKIA